MPALEIRPIASRVTSSVAAAVLALLMASTSALAADNAQLDRIRKYAIGSAAASAFGASRAQTPLPSAGNGATEVGQEAAGVSGEAASEQSLDRIELGTQPFGASLFGGQFARERPSGVNPQYKIAPGDQIAVNLYGAQQFSEVVPVDAQGNLFVPEVGPIPVAGISNSQLQKTVESRVNRIFTDNVQVYVNLMGAQALGVFVTGAVRNPGRYAGLPSDSLLSFIDKAGGIALQSGSFRNVSILRGGQPIAKADLYDFLLRGALPTPQFKDGDVILIGPIGGAITVNGDARATAAFEFPRFPVLGRELASYARPKADVTHVAFSGFRNGQPFNSYVPYQEFLGASLQDGDLVIFQADLKAEEVFVEVEGAHQGAGLIAIGRGVTLDSVLDLIPVDPRVAATDSIFIRRESVARDQKRALDRTLDELERTALSALSQTPSQAAIREQEARLVLEFIKRARSVQPDGRVVVSTDAGRADIRMEAGDQIVIPQQTDLVLVSGEVVLPASVAFTPGASVADYVRQAGGYAERADPDKIVVIRASGAALVGADVEVRRGDQILVLPGVDPKFFQIGADIIEILFRVAIIAAAVVAL